jgi:hypothetical protein
MELKRIKIASLKSAKHNPKARTTSKSIRSLVNSIERVGLLYPILVTKNNEIIDGHRRVSAFKELRIEEIPVIVGQSENADECYAEVNANSQKLNGNQTLSVYLKNPLAVTHRARGSFQLAEARLGRRLLERMAEHGFSLRIYRVAQHIAHYVAVESDNAFLTKASVWLMKHRNLRLVQGYIELKQNPKILYNAILSGRALEVTFK